MQELYKQKLILFANDQAMMDAVYAELLDTFLEEKPQYEVYVAAAERIAVDKLKKGWRKLEGKRTGNIIEQKASGNPGL